MHKHFNKFLQSAVVLPVMTAQLALGPLAGTSLPTAAVISPDINRTPAITVAAKQQSLDLDVQAQKVDAFFAQYDLPLAGYGKKLVSAAKENDLPPYVLASIAFNESTGCKFVIKGTNNCFGWGSGKIRFKTIEDSIDTVAAAISGNDPDVGYHYEGKTLAQVLTTYNGAGVNPRYVKNVLKVMDQMENMNVQTPIAASSDNSKV